MEQKSIKNVSLKKLYSSCVIVAIAATAFLTVAYFLWNEDGGLSRGMMIIFWVLLPFEVLFFWAALYGPLAVVHVFYETELFVKKDKKTIKYEDVLTIKHCTYYRAKFHTKIMKITYREGNGISSTELAINRKNALKIKEAFNLNIEFKKHSIRSGEVDA